MKILLIAGHGQGDPGACGNGYKEADLTREVVTLLNKNLSAYTEVDVFDFNKDMFQYLKSGNKYPFNNYDYVIEIHFNAFNTQAYGTEVLVHQNEDGVGVETAIASNIAKLGFVNRGVKRRGDLRVMNTVKKVYGVSHALIEVCFVDNASDMQKYAAKKEEIAKAITDGVVQGFNLDGKVIVGKTPIAEVKELEEINDIVWELANRKIISDKDLWLEKLQEDTNAYWLARKAVNYIIKNI